MNYFRKLFAFLLLALTTGCGSPKKSFNSLDIMNVLAQTGGPYLDIAALQHGRWYLLYPIASFVGKNGRFPKDYSELTDYVRESNGYLKLGQYERVALLQLPDGSLEVHYVPKGKTNEVRFTTGPVAEQSLR